MTSLVPNSFPSVFYQTCKKLRNVCSRLSSPEAESETLPYSSFKRTSLRIRTYEGRGKKDWAWEKLGYDAVTATSPWGVVNVGQRSAAFSIQEPVISPELIQGDARSLPECISQTRERRQDVEKGDSLQRQFPETAELGGTAWCSL